MMAAGRLYFPKRKPSICADGYFREWAQRVKESDGLIHKKI